MKQNPWFDPFFIFENLSNEDKLIQKNVKQFCDSELRQNAVKYNHDHFFDKELYKAFGNLGILGSTIKKALKKTIKNIRAGLELFIVVVARILTLKII